MSDSEYTDRQGEPRSEGPANNTGAEQALIADRRRSKRAVVQPAQGVTTRLNSAARQRREHFEALAAIARAAPTERHNRRPTLTIAYMAIERIKPANRRTRRQTAQQTARIRNSLAEFNACRPILVDRDLRVIEGHAVLAAATDLGWDEVPVIVIDHLAPSKIEKLAIALNRLGELGSWDEQALGQAFAKLIDLGEDVLVTGFEQPEIEQLVLLDDESEACEEDDIPAAAEVAISRPRDVWRLGPHRLVQGDARDPATYAALMLGGDVVRLLATDQPYNVKNAGHVTSRSGVREFAMAGGEMTREEFAAFIQAWIKAALPYLMDGGLLATFIDWRSVEAVLAAGRELGLSLLNFIVWAKSNAGQGSLWRSQHELLPVFKNGSASHINNVALGRFGRWRSNVWSYPGASSLGSDARDGLTLHPTVKPVAMLVDALLDVTNRGDIVLDPFSGTGSTLIAAERTGRICRAIEFDGLYCDVILQRWQNLTGRDAVLEATGETFTEVSARLLTEEAR